MKRLLLLTLFLLYTVNYCHAQSQDCSEFRIGTFKYLNPEQEHFIIIRNDSIQVEKNTKNGLSMTGSIKWLSDCQYTLTYTNVNDKNFSSIIGTTFNIDITSTTGNTYKYLAYDDKRKMNGEIKKIKQQSHL